MIVYISMLLVSILFILLANKLPKKWQKVICYIFAALPFFVVSAFRYNLGTDYEQRYVGSFKLIVEGKKTWNLESGYIILAKLCTYITTEYYIIFIVTSAIIIGLIMLTIFTKSKNALLSVIIFFLGGFFFDSLNIMRQYLAISLIIFGYRFLLGKKRYWILYVACVLLAASMHSSAIIMLVLLLFPKKMLSSYLWVLPSSIAILLLNENLFNILEIVIKDTRFVQYLTGQFAQGDVSFLFLAENLALYIFMYYIYRKNKKINNIETEDILFLNIQACAWFAMCAATCHMLFLRIALYFSAFQIISVPYYISKIPATSVIEDIQKLFFNKLNFSKCEKYISKVVTVMVVLCFMVAFYRTNILANTNEVIPYRTIFNKTLEIK